MKVGVDARLLTEQVTGIGRYTYEVCRYLARINEPVFLYTPSPVSEKIQDALAPAVIKNDQAYGRIGRMLWSQRILPKRAAIDGVEVFWGATHRIPQFLDEHIARVVTIHDLVWKKAGATMRPFSKLMESLLMPRAIAATDLIMADSEATAQEIAHYFPEAASKTRVVYLGATEFPASGGDVLLADFGIQKPYFLFVGTLEPRKNLQRLLEACANLSEELRESYVLVIAGGQGWGGIDLQQMVRSLKIEKQVHILGYVGDEALSTLYKHARFLVMPSIYEGFGLPLVEAMSFGRPVLTSNTSSMPEVAAEAGLLVDPYSVDSIRIGLEQLLGSDELVQRLARSAPVVASRFSWERTAKEAMEVFNEALEIRKSKIK